MTRQPGRKEPSPRRRPRRPVEAEPAKVLAFLAHLATEFTAVLQMSDLIDRVLHGLKEEVGIESATIGLIDERDPDTLVIVGATGLRNDATGLRIPRGHGLSWATMEQNAPLYVPDLHADGRQARR